jgi:hypothetical protein
MRSCLTKGIWTVGVLLACQSTVVAGQGATKHAHAQRIVGAAPRIDGALDDGAWSTAPVISDFVQKTPTEGAAPSVQTEVRLLYDDDALYVGARMRRPDPQNIRRSITRRDGDSDAEVFMISLDSYNDKRTAYEFSVSSGGVRGDFYHPQDSQDSGREPTYDPIWSARTRIDSEGWTAEMRIPFSQLRFNAGAVQTWGIEMSRKLPDRSEELQWVLIPVDAAGFSSRFGTLDGIERIPAARRIELLPYVAGDLTYRANVDPANPFNDKAVGRAGGDLKVGLGPNLTLDATVNPDFGQVEADPAVVNLSAFETVFDERRPFFIEGNEMLTGRSATFLGRPTWFYTRRIGATPPGTVTGDFVRQPLNTTILSAAKITGRLPSRLTVGILAAATPREYADIFNLGEKAIDRIAVGAPSEFGVLRLQQEFGTKQSNVGFSMTGIHRSLDERGGLNSLLTRDAIAGGTDWKLRYMQGMWELTGWVGGSHVDGDASAIAALQRSSAHYFQRPDQTHITYDPTLTSLSGYTASIRGDKNAGKRTLGGIQLAVRSQGLEINDVGQMQRGDAVDFNMDVQIRDTKVRPYWRYWQLGTSTQDGWNLGGIRQYSRVNESARVILPNFWTITGQYTYYVRALVDNLTRGGPLMQSPKGWLANASITTRVNVPTVTSVKAEYFKDELGGWRWTFRDSTSTRPSARWQVSLIPTYEHAVDSRQYISTLAGGPVVTYGSRYVFAYDDRSTLSARFRLNYAFTPNFTIQGYAEPFAASGRFYDFGELAAPRVANLRTYGATGTGSTITNNADGSHTVKIDGQSFALGPLDFNKLSFRSNLVLRWEWLPGSTAYLIWQQSRANSDPLSRLIGPSDLWDSVRTAGDNFFALKISYWIGVR